LPKRSDPLSSKQPVTETELAILEVLWKAGPSTVREIVQAIYGRHTASLHATVNSLIDRLREKGHVEVADAGFARRYAAAVTRDALVGDTLQQLADRHFDGAVTPLLLTLIDRFKLSDKDRDAIRRIIDDIK
jgi:BlaI family transcriptional regulator, penicillinase repressor